MAVVAVAIRQMAVFRERVDDERKDQLDDEPGAQSRRGRSGRGVEGAPQK